MDAASSASVRAPYDGTRGACLGSGVILGAVLCLLSVSGPADRLRTRLVLALHPATHRSVRQRGMGAVSAPM